MSEDYKNELLESIRLEEEHCEHCPDNGVLEICLCCGIHGNINDFQMQLNNLD